MVSWLLPFVVVGLIAAGLGCMGVTGVTSCIAWILLVVFLVGWLISMQTHRSRPVG